MTQQSPSASQQAPLSHDPAMPKPTPLHDLHVSLGAVMTDFAGWSMPLRYGSEIAEHKAVRGAAGLFDLTHMGEIEVTGPEAGRALDYALVGDISAIGPKKAKYTMICQEDGGIIDDLIVYRLGEQHYLVVANASNAEVVVSKLRQRTGGFSATVADRCDNWALLAIQGPNAATILAPLTEADLTTVRYYAATEATVAGSAVILARTGYTGEDGFEIFCDPSDATSIWRQLSVAGAGHGLVPAGLACRDTLRLEAGMPLYGHELTSSLTPYAAGLGRVVKLDKAEDFVGRAALAALAGQDVARRLVGLVASGRRVPRAGYPVIDPDHGGVVGEVTSGAPSPTLGQPVAMAYVDTALTSAGTPLLVDIRGAAEPATVVDLPFYRRSR
jgi:aminomethyltransferase